MSGLKPPTHEVTVQKNQTSACRINSQMLPIPTRTIFLKTVIPSRKATRDDLMQGEDDVQN
jgi:hypothetical protein